MNRAIEPSEQERPLTDDLIAEVEPRYLRAPKVVPVRRGRAARKMRHAAFAGALVAVILIPLAYGAYRLAHYILSAPRFGFGSSVQVTIEGNRYVSREEFMNALAFTPDANGAQRTNIFRLHLGAVRAEVESIPWVESATVLRTFPASLAIFVVERTPVAFAEVGGHIELVDRDGVLLDPPSRAMFDFPILAGLANGQTPSDRLERVQLFLTFMQATRNSMKGSGWTVSQVDVSDPSDLKALIVSGQRTILVHFGRREFGARLTNLLALLPRIEKLNAPVDSVDLRYKNQVVVNPVAPGATKPAAQN